MRCNFMWNLIILCCWVPPHIQATERSRGALGPRVFTFVHGDDKAKLNFTSADDYCKHAVGQSKPGTSVNGVRKESGMWDGGEKFKRWSSNHSHDQDLVLETRLASVHSYPETVALVKWVSKQEKHSFWIGGTWTDGSRADFSFLRLPNEELSRIRVGEHLCVSVDYHSGQWGIHPCSEMRYFVCLTVPVLKSSVSDNKTEERKEERSEKRIAVPMPEPWTNPTMNKQSPEAHRRMTSEELRLLLS
ncbi:Bone marrow proteoglycan [Fasciola gigantica]|uniref:Bone marrow proteoglycan n=1 Tax=Fasciola gigantica TaxID=46835 RepID=A0A504YYI8_FASGI|nr:Bone marrow proteoglycan [Fasciola gigantica]